MASLDFNGGDRGKKGLATCPEQYARKAAIRAV
jgi:hypothetical protein